MQMKSYAKKNIESAKAFGKAFIYWLVLGIAVGLICGVIGAAFSKSVSFVTELRTENEWLIYLLPLGGLLSVAIYKLCRVESLGTNQVFESIRSEKPLSFLLAPAIFAGSVITHLLGGSAGREGAALQLGGSASSLIAKIFKLDDKSRHILTICGMGAVFSAIFGTPIGACVFALEVVSVGQICSAAIFPSIVSSVTAYLVSSGLGVKPERFHIDAIPAMNIDSLWRILVVAVAAAVVSMIFCQSMHLGEKLFKKYIKNPFIRIFAGGAVVILLTLIVGTRDYNGGGVNVIERIFEEGTVRPEAFLLKIIFTVITISAGFKGGEIVPTLFIGATLGGTVGPLVGLNPAFGAATGIAAMFCGVTNCPLATFFICIELFGAEGMIFYAVAAAVSFVLSGYTSLYHSQHLIFSKLKEEIIDIEAK